MNLKENNERKKNILPANQPTNHHQTEVPENSDVVDDDGLKPVLHQRSMSLHISIRFLQGLLGKCIYSTANQL